MAEGGSTTGAEGESWENWFGGWMQTAKEKSQTALEFVKKDLAEFGSTVQKETEKAVEMTKGSLHSESTTEATNKVKAGLASFLDNISKVLVIPPDDDNYVPMKVAPDGTGLYDRGKARLHALQLDASTYIDPPRGPPEQYNMWLESFNLDQHKGEISELLVSKVEVRALYTKLVPSDVSNADFWQRYFYRVHQLQCDEARKQALMMRADQTGGKESVSWDDDDDEDEEICDDGDDGNHSDWEKMPRPPQSFMSQQKSAEQTEGASKEAIGAHGKDQSTPTFASPSGRQADKAPQDQVKEMEASTSAYAAEPSLKATQAIPSSSQNVDASGDSAEWSPVEMVANPWSLHIPEDLASASDAVEEQSPQDGHNQPSQQVLPDHSNEGSAAGAEAVPEENPTVFLADGACGAADVGPDQVATSHRQIQQQSVEISTAGSAEPSQPPTTEESSTQEVIAKPSEASTKPPSRLKEMSTPSASLKEGESPQDHQKMAESGESEQKCKDTHAVADPQQATNAGTKGTDFKPVNVNDSQEEGAEPVRSQGGDSQAPADSAIANDKEIAMRVKGDMVVVGDRDSPSSTESSDTKDLGLGEDWEQDFDVEITEEDLKAAEDIAKRLGENLDDNDDDWENWE